MSGDEAIAQTLKSLGSPAVLSAKLIDAPADSGDSGQWLSIQVDSNQGADVHSRWLARLVQGAVADQMRTDQQTTSDVLSGAELVDQDPSGQQLITYLGHGGVLGGQQFQSPSDDAIKATVDQVAAKDGLGVDSVAVLHPLDSALAVTFTVPNGSVDWTLDQLEQQLEGDPPNLEGLFVQLDSPSGEILVQSGSDFRTAGGTLHFADGQDDRFGINVG